VIFYVIMYVDFIRFMVVGLEIRSLSFVIKCSCMFVVQVSQPSNFCTLDSGSSLSLIFCIHVCSRPIYWGEGIYLVKKIIR
jgi:hypothetical protein